MSLTHEISRRCGVFQTLSTCEVSHLGHGRSERFLWDTGEVRGSSLFRFHYMRSVSNRHSPSSTSTCWYEDIRCSEYMMIFRLYIPTPSLSSRSVDRTRVTWPCTQYCGVSSGVSPCSRSLVCCAEFQPLFKIHQICVMIWVSHLLSDRFSD